MPPPTDTAVLQIAPPVGAVLPGEQRVLEAAERSLQGQRRGMRAMWPFLGPAFIAAVAYVDPGNFATNLAGGAKFGYLLLWVILVSNLMAMLIQTMSAKLGIATGMNLPEVCRAKFPTPVTIGLWIQAEVIAMATDLAEFIGAALGLNLLFGIPLVWAGLLTGVFAFAILALQTKGGFRHLEAIIIGLVGLIVAGFAFEVVNAGASAHGVATGLVIPRFSGSESVLLAAGILGATVMPHVIYLHSALTQRRVVGATAEARMRIFRFELVDVIIAMSIAGCRQHGDADHGGGGVPRQRLRRRREHPARLARARDGGGRPRPDHVRHRPARVGALVVVGRHAGRPGRDAGLHPPLDPAVPAPRPDHGAGHDRARDRRRTRRGPWCCRRSRCRSGSRSRSSRSCCSAATAA